MSTENTEVAIPEKEKTVAAPLDQKQAEGLSLVGQLAMRILNSPDAGVDALERVMKMQSDQIILDRKWAIEDRDYQAKKAYLEDFAKAQGEMPQIMKNSKNKHSDYEYANLEAVYLAVSQVIAEYGFSTSFTNGMNPISKDHYHVILVVGHKDGHVQEYEDHVPLAGVGLKGNASMTATQAHGATKTYARRYLMLDVWNPAVMNKDSDGNVNNISDNAQVFLDRITDAKTMKDIEVLSADISAAGRKLPAVDYPPVRTAWAQKKKLLENAH